MVEINVNNEKLYQEKADIIEWINNLTDYEIISRIKFIKDQPLTDWADELVINEQNAILEGLEDIENQRFVPNSKLQELNLYDDNYVTCYETHATLRIYDDNLHPNELTKYFNIEPSSTQVKVEISDLQTDKLIKLNGWFLSTEGQINSKDCRRHIDYLLDKLLPIVPKIKILINEGAKIDIICFWSSQSGHGGPSLLPQQLTKLANLGVEIWFDIYI